MKTRYTQERLTLDGTLPALRVCSKSLELVRSTHLGCNLSLMNEFDIIQGRKQLKTYPDNGTKWYRSGTPGMSGTFLLFSKTPHVDISWWTSGWCALVTCYHDESNNNNNNNKRTCSAAALRSTRGMPLRPPVPDSVQKAAGNLLQ